jgi:hypothetical protein
VRYGWIGGRREKVRGVYRFSSLVKQNKKAKICFVIYIAGERNFFYIYAVIVKQKKKALLITTHVSSNSIPPYLRTTAPTSSRQPTVPATTANSAGAPPGLTAGALGPSSIDMYNNDVCKRFMK